MANFRRRRPRKQPRSVMSSPDRVFDIDKPNNEYPQHIKKRRRRKKPFVIESRWNTRWRARGWVIWGRYATQTARDQALDALRKKTANTTYNGKPLHRIEFRIPPNEESSATTRTTIERSVAGSTNL